jgi:hypothetical protein
MRPQVPEEEPLLRLGTAGFSSSEKDQLGPAMGSAVGLRWTHAALADADAWMLHGGRVTRVGSGEIRVVSTVPGEQVLRLTLRDVQRPLAFAEPLPPSFEPLCRFDLASPTSVEAAFRRLEIWLRPMRARFVLGAQVVAGGAELRHGIFHLSQPDDGKLLAVLDFRSGKAALAPDLHPVQIAQAQWDKRPAGAGKPPPGFVGLTTAQLSWTFVRHSAGRHLPAHYRERTIHYRGRPRVPLSWLTDAQLAVLRELALGPGTLAALQERTGLTGPRLDEDLACLYYASAITTTTAKAKRVGGRAESAFASADQSMRSDPGELAAEDAKASQGPTVPAWLPSRAG